MVVLFDIDDTLVDHSESFRLATRALYESLDIDEPAEGFVSSWKAAHRRQFDRFLAGEVSYEGQRRARVRDVLGSHVSDTEADAVFNVYLAAYEASWSLFSDVEPCLDRLSSHRLGVISNGQSRQQRQKLDRLGISTRFEHVVISEDCGARKPDPAIFRRACALFDEPPWQAFHLGDVYDLDACAAREAGLMGVWLDRERCATTAHIPPHVQTLEELPALIASLSGRGRGMWLGT